MKRIALYGQPALAHKYIDIIDLSDRFLLSGVKSVNGDFNYPANIINRPVFIFEKDDDLIACSDAIIFLNFQNSQYFLLKRALKESKHIFINPSSFIPSEILFEMQKLGEEAGTLYYLRHKSLNEELLKQFSSSYGHNTEFIDIYRYIPAGNEKTQSLIHKIIGKEVMFIHSLVQHEIKKIRIKTVPYCSLSPYIINIRFDFSNSLAVNLTINFFTQNNARFAELYYGNKMLRINSDENKIELASRDAGKFKIDRKNFSLNDEGKLIDEIQLFLELLSEENYPVKFQFSGLAVHQTIYYILNEIFENRKNEVRL